MANSVNNVLYSALGDGSRSTHYRVILSVPEDVTKVGPTKSTEHLNVAAKSVSIPSIEHVPIDIKIQGHNVPVQGKTNFVQGFSITFYSDERHEIRDLFVKWLRVVDSSLPSNPDSSESFLSVGGVDLGSINPFEALSGSLGTGDAQNISNASTLKVQVMDFLEQRVTAEYTFTDCYPIGVEGVTFDGSQVSTIQEFTVNFKYTTYAMSVGTGLLDVASDLVDRGVDAALGGITSLLGSDSNSLSTPRGRLDSAISSSGGNPDTRDIFEKRGLVP